MADTIVAGEIEPNSCKTCPECQKARESEAPEA